MKFNRTFFLSCILFITLLLLSNLSMSFAAEKLKVALYLNGNLGDKAFFDSAARGVNRAIDELGIEAKIIEGGFDPSRWEPDLEQLAQGDWDMIIAGTWQLTEIVEKNCTYPTRKEVCSL